MEQQEQKNIMKQKKQRSLTIPIPRLTLASIQTAVLLLLIAVGVLQTVQIYGLETELSSSEPQNNSSSTLVSPKQGGSATSSLPNMVGGC